MATDPEQARARLSSFGKLGKSSGEIGSAEEEPLIAKGIRPSPENYSVSAAILPFLFPALGGLLYGYDIGSTSCATISIETSGSLYGALIGSILAFNIADILGRRRELILAALLYLVGALVTALAPDFIIMVVGRFVFGIGIGLAMHAAPMYIAETAPTPMRGQLISLKEFFIVLGMVGGYGIGSLLVDLVAGWRYMYGASTPLAVIMGMGMWWLPASPRWLLLCAMKRKGDMQDLRESAISCLCRLRGQSIGDSAPTEVDEILTELSYVGEDKEVSLREVFHGKCLKALIIGAGLVLFQQITGQPSVLYYAASILQSAGFSAASDATRVSILLGLFKLIMTGLAVLVVERLGRRPLLLGGVSGIVISLFLLGSYYLFLDDVPAVAVVALLLYVGCYQLSFGPIGWLMISEVFPLRLRGRGLSVAVLVNFGANALVTFAFSPLKDLLGAGILFYAFGVIAVLSLAFIFFIIPETKGLTLEEIEAKCLFRVLHVGKQKSEKAKEKEMGKYNVVMKRKRAEKAVRKRAIHGDPVTAKLKNKPQNLSVSGKRQRKLLKKWRRDQKEAADKGLITMQDVEMMAASQPEHEEGTSQDTNKTTTKFHLKKSLKLKQLKRRGKKTKAASKPAAVEASVDSMVE
ncbi:D-xylose-proton symporter-like 2 [Citrus sinensis]|nr:D-xylose-proton symporter-like 2 [Citrus sinensis]